MDKFIVIILCLIVGARAFYPKCDGIGYEIVCMCHPDMEAVMFNKDSKLFQQLKKTGTKYQDFHLSKF